ncbi:uncharacterized protein [Amphiura filiformis]|uniref:uncharacterized protein n=1 Tax=Amphiura filiformis TaxID=82378 RepID=UPI003B21743A
MFLQHYLTLCSISDLSYHQDGHTALHWAARKGHTDTCEILLKYNADVNAVEGHGDTALHFAARRRDAIDLCIYLIENGANVSAQNMNGENPMFTLPNSGNVFHSVYTAIQEDTFHKAIQRAKYKDLMQTGSTPVQIVKLFICGAPTAGKTTLKNSLTKDLQETELESGNHLQELPYNPTAGIDISKSTIKGVGTFRIWDLAGHVEYHISHAMFLGAENSIFIVMYNLIKKLHMQDLHYWLCFLKSGHSTTQPTKPKVIIVASHMDQVEDKKTGYRVAQLNQTKMRRLFQESLDIVDSVITVNACNATEQGYEILKDILKQMAVDILGTRMLPLICQNILDQSRRWYMPSYPVLPWSFFFERVKEIAGKQVRDIESLIEENTVRTAAAYLHDMGEIYVANDESDDACEAMIIMNTQWLCSNVIAKVLAGDEFPAQFQKLPDKPLYSEDELREFLVTGEGLDFELTVLLLEHLKILFTTNNGSFLIPSKLPPSLPLILIEKSDNVQLYGIRVECVDETDMFSPDFFPHIHLHMLECYPEAQGKANYSNSAVKFISTVEGMVQKTDMGRAINVAVICKNRQERPEAHSQLQSLQRSIKLYLRQCSPGTVVAWKFLSPKSLKTEGNLENVLYYEPDDLHKAEEGNGTVYHSRQTHADNMVDVICQGVDMMFITELGGLSGWEWLPLELQQQICAVLDKTHPLGNDHRMLAQIFGIPEDKFLRLVRFCSTTKDRSITDEILREVCATRRRNGHKLAIQEVMTVLKHPGIIGNDDLAKRIESVLIDKGHQVTHHDPSYDFGVPDLTLLWRAVLKRTHQDLKRTIKASQLLLYLVGEESQLSEDDEDEIETKEKLEGRRKAVDLLLFKLMQLKKPDWCKGFLAGLQQEAPSLVPMVTDARDKLLQEKWFASIPAQNASEQQSATDLITSRALIPSHTVYTKQDRGIVQRKQEVVKFKTEELMPYNMPVKQKFQMLASFKAILSVPKVRETLINIITEDTLDHFLDISRLDKDQIRQQFINHGQHAGAEYFLDRLGLMGTFWPQHLMQALQAQKHYDYMQYLYEEYQDYLKLQEDQPATEEIVQQPKVPQKPQKSADEIAVDLQHMYIWEKVVDLKMVMLREIASEAIIRTLSTHMPDFLQMYKREFTARKSSDGETRAVRWIMDRLQKCKDGRWPGALIDILQCNDALLDEIRREFWRIHDKGCSCEEASSQCPDDVN